MYIYIQNKKNTTCINSKDVKEKDSNFYSRPHQIYTSTSVLLSVRRIVFQFHL